MDKTCSKCESKHWMTDLYLNGGVSPPIVSLYLGFKGGLKGRYSGLRANVCGDCGYTEFYAMDHKAMWEEWSKQNR